MDVNIRLDMFERSLAFLYGTEVTVIVESNDQALVQSLTSHLFCILLAVVLLFR